MSKKRIVLDVLAAVSLIAAVVIYVTAESAWQKEVEANHWSGFEALSMYDLLLALAVVFLIVFWRSLVCLVCGIAKWPLERAGHVFFIAVSLLGVENMAGGPITKTAWRALPSDVRSYFWVLVIALPILRIIHAAVWFMKHMSENEDPQSEGTGSTAAGTL